MQKRWFLVGVVLLVPWLLGGCGIAQEQYDTVVADLDKAQQETQSVKAELGTTQAKVSELTSSLEKAETELGTAQAKVSEMTSSLGETENELETTQTELEATQGKLEAVETECEAFKSETRRLWILLDGNLALNHAILRTNSGILLDDLDEVEKGCLDITARLATLKDLKVAELKALWEEAYGVEGDEWRLYYAPFERFMALNASRINNKTDALRDKLAPVPLPAPVPAPPPVPPLPPPLPPPPPS